MNPKPKPILFNAPMVRGLIREVECPGAGKTQTRRILTADIPEDADEVFAWFRKRDWQGEQAPSGVWARQHIRDDYEGGNPHGGYLRHIAPLRWEPGDLLWVRETWANTWDMFDSDDPPRVRTCYAADHPGDPKGLGWKPSIHMPRERSRLTLEVTAVKVERLQDISEEDALAEGVTKVRDHCYVIRGFDYDTSGLCHSRPSIPFAKLWDHLNGDGAWNANPWVVAIAFKPYLANVEALLKEREGRAAA